MGQKVHPFGFRLGFNKTWRSRWYSDRDYAKLLHEDLKLRDTLKARFAHADVSTRSETSCTNATRQTNGKTNFSRCSPMNCAIRSPLSGPDWNC